MARKKFKATKGARFSQKEAQIYGEELDRISKENNGTLSPSDVVEKARNRRNPLHEYFEWNDNKAGEGYRIYQARNLINHIVVVIKYDHKQKEHKAFLSVNETPQEIKKNKIYVTIERVLSEPKLRQQILNEAIKEIEFWQERYHEYKELGRIFRAIKSTKRKIIKKKKKK